jgi:hypothetical protein
MFAFPMKAISDRTIFFASAWLGRVLINELDDQRLANRALPNRSGHGRQPEPGKSVESDPKRTYGFPSAFSDLIPILLLVL